MTADAPTIAYVPCLAGRALEVLALDSETGSLTRLQVVDLGGGGRPLAISPDGTRIYVSVSGELDGGEAPNIQTYAIDGHDGTAAKLGEIGAEDRIAHLHVDPSGTCLLVVSFKGGFVAAYRLGPDGCPEAAPACRIPVDGRPHQITTDDDGNGVLVPDMQADVVRRFRLDRETATLSPDDPGHFKLGEGSGPRHLVRHLHLPITYVLGELDGSVRVCNLSTVLQHVSLLPDGFCGEPWAAEIRLAPDGHGLFASERRSNTLTGFAVDPGSGHLSHRFTCPVEPVPRGFAIDRSGRWLILAGKASDHIAVYRIDPELRNLTPVSRIRCASEPNFLETLERA